MKHKYLISKGQNDGELMIQESAELDKGIFSELFIERFQLEQLAAVQSDPTALLSLIRTPGFYPTELCATKLAQAVQAFFQSGSQEPIEVPFDDMETLVRDRELNDYTEMESEASVEIDDLLDDEIDEDDFLEDDDLTISPAAAPSLRVADDDDGLDDDDK